MKPLAMLLGLLWAAALPSPPAAAQAYFRVAERDGRAWLLDPDGQPFFSTGVNVFHTGAEPATFDPRRPEYSGLRQHTGFDAWCASARRRLADWGFNTLGAWAEPRAVECTGLPYTVCLHLGQWVGAPWIDPLSPGAQASIRMLIEREVLPRRDDRRLLGYFVDNELHWYAGPLFGYWAAEPGDRRLKRALFALLEEHYRGDLPALLADFAVKPRPRRWADLAGALGQVRVRPGRHPAVIERFVALLADEYYRTVTEAVRAADPHHLLLGDRYASSYSQAVARVSARYMDVISVNYAGNEPGGWVSPAFFDTLHEVTGKPLLVGEFYTAARENRSANANRKGPYLVVATQRERAATVAGLVTRLARLPYVVGYHWFQWSDQPSSGREDGEDFNMGLVDLEDRPYEELTAAFARVNTRVREVHQEGRPPQGLALVDGSWSVPPATHVQVDGELHEWELARHWAPGAVAREPELPFGDFYVGWRPEGLVLGLDYQDYTLAPPTSDPRGRKRLALELDGGAHLLVLGLDERRRGRPAALTAIDASGRPSASLRGAQRRSNLRTTAEVLVPAALFGRQRLQAGDALTLGLALVLEGETRELGWPARAAASLRLEPQAAP